MSIALMHSILYVSLVPKCPVSPMPNSGSYVTGVAVIIGAATKKVLQVIPKNSKCHTCKVSPAKEHECAMNHKGSSGSMESKGIVEGFERATDYGCYYLEYVGDGDSSVADSIICNVSIIHFLEYENHRSIVVD